MDSLGQNRTIAAGVKRSVTQAAINDSVKRNKVSKSIGEFLQESNASQQWKTPEGDDFFDTKTHEVFAKPTELTNNDVVFDVKAGDKYLHMDSLYFRFKVKIEKKNAGGDWIVVPTAELIIVKPGAILDLINRELEVRLIHPGDNIDHKVINIKQDKTAYNRRFDMQRKYDKLYVENELEEGMQLAKEWTYGHLFSNDGDTHADLKPNNGAAAFGLRAVNKKVKFTAGSIHAKCKKFADELKTGKEFFISAAVLNPVFETPIIPQRHGVQIKFSLGRDEDHAQYIEDYTALAAGTEATVYRFSLQKTGANKVSCEYDVSKMTTTASAKYNDMFKSGKAIETAAFMVYHHQHRTIEKDAVDIQDVTFPNTTDTPVYVSWELVSREDYNHKSSRANFLNNSFLNHVKKIKWQGANQANTSPRDGVTTIDLDDRLDKNFLYNQQRRWFLGREQQSMSNIEPAYGVLNGASKEIYANQCESKASFMKMNTERHIAPIITEFDPSHGKYGVDQKHPSVPNLSIKASLEFLAPMPESAELVITSAYRGKFTQRKTQNGTVTMNFLQVDISETLL